MQAAISSSTRQGRREIQRQQPSRRPRILMRDLDGDDDDAWRGDESSMGCDGATLHHVRFHHRRDD